MRSVTQHNFAQVPRAEIPRSSFDRSSSHKTTIDSGYLYPIWYDEALPGDTFSLNMSVFARLATPLHPFMDNMRFSTFFFFVPFRLLWDNFPKFMGEQRNPGDSTDYLMPRMISPAGGYGELSIYDYFGLPTKVAGVSHSSMLLRAYNLIWNEWFRDQNLQNSVPVSLADTDDPSTNYTLLRRGKRHDYFSSALPWPQKGPGATIPLGTSAPIKMAAGEFIHFSSFGGTGTFPMGVPATDGQSLTRGVASGGTVPAGQATLANPSGMIADLSLATAATINQLRQAFQLQKLQERDARGGTRYTEIVRAHFNVVSPDARLQRPEYLGGSTSPVNLHQVPQTSATDAEPTPQGSMAAYGTSSFSGHGFSKSFTEHGVLLGLVSVSADLNYQQGLNRMWSRRTKYDFYWPALSMIGEQAVLNKEIYCDGTPDDDLAWGYQERFGDYRYKPSIITGRMRSNAAQSLDTWHLAQDFATRPLLNAAFIEDRPPVERVVAVTTEPQFILDSFAKLRCARPMPVWGVPGLIDHF